MSAPSWLAFQHFTFCSGISSIQGNLRDTTLFVLLLGGGCTSFTLVFSHSRVPVAADEGKLSRSVTWDEQRVEEEESWKRQIKMLAGSVGLGHELFPAISTGTLLTVPFNGLTPSYPARDRGSLPMNSSPAFQSPLELFLPRVCLLSAGTFPKFCCVQSKFRSPGCGAKSLCIILWGADEIS